MIPYYVYSLLRLLRLRTKKLKNEEILQKI